MLFTPGQPDEHYAERAFLHEAFVPAFGLAGLTYLQPQAPFVDSAGKQRRIDFLLNTGTKYALEVEGRRYHSSSLQDSERFDDEKARQRDLAKQGFRYTPFSFNDIRSGRAEGLLTDLCADDLVLFRLVRARVEDDGTPPAGLLALHSLELLLQQLPTLFPEVQKAVLALLSDSTGKKQLTLVDFEPELPLLPLAVMDIVSLIERVGVLYGCPVGLPQIYIHTVRPRNPELYRDLLAAYPLSNTSFPDAPQTGITLEDHTEPSAELSGDYLFAADDNNSAPVDALRPKLLARFSSRLLAQVSSPPQEDTPPANVERHLLDFFARRYFTLPEVKPEQAHLVQRALLGQSGLGILPTGFGKSLVFQLYAVMVPQTTLVISPLKALMRDQLHSMHRLGLSCVDAITGADAAPLKDRKMAAFRARKLRLLYISPERLQIKAFYEELRDSMASTPVGAIVVDEAHCVSEWGHDFRPAYLQIGNLRELLAEASGRSIPLLAMTATASELVRKDIRSVLNLPEDSVVQLSSSDRPNLSLSVHPVPSSAKPAYLESLLKKTLPAVLKIPANDLVPHGKPPPYTHAGVVFAVYANPHGRGTLPEGVHAIAQTVNERVTFDPELVRVHASTAPTVCPTCKSPLWIPMSKAELKLAGMIDTSSKRCLACGETFVRYASLSNWDKTISKNQDDFQNNDFPILIATKGYGMGIDKRNLRFIVHHALSSGLEGYYQEAGRAGRDGNHSHVALLYAPPTPTCLSQLRSQPEPPCVTEKANFMFHKCPFGLETLCDYGKQARFIHSSYAGVSEDVQDVMTIYDTLVAGQPIETDERFNEDESKDTQLALYRLQQLGMVEGYALKYKSLTRIEFSVTLNAEWSPDRLVDRLKDLLLKFEYSEEQAEARVAPLRPKSTQRRRVQAAPADKGRSLLESSASILLERVYQTVPRMRYDMLRNELDYATSNTCRRLVLRGRFDDAAYLPTDDYQCGFCDVCVPDLNFTRKEAAIPARDAQMEEVARMLPDLMQAFNRDDLTRVIQTSVLRGAVAGMYSRAVSRLESDSTNLSALYLSGALARRRPDRKLEAMQFLKRGFQEGVVQGAELPALLDFSREASHVEPAEGFHLLTPIKGPFNTDVGLALVEHEAATLFGTQADETRTVRAVRKTKTLAKTADAVVATLQDSVADLLQGFTDLDELLQEAS
ncbi:DEAD/DEAH box helicase [Deinococcus sp. Arct2-2]|uniref:RecQ family ATP-dependent DNA helicase n=1 Tax=Deinococcus sp. Arct2-2 TaxID=2568653 RepID=UPI001454CC26|nr:DEAD/DEAH box helicase [Deinococcus sp. Arct2-2]